MKSKGAITGIGPDGFADLAEFQRFVIGHNYTRYKIIIKYLTFLAAVLSIRRFLRTLKRNHC